MKVTVSRKISFNAAHRLNNPNWDAQRNRDIFGVCNNENYHGHNYELFVKLTGEVNEETGYVYDLGKLKDLVNENIVNRFDHKNLNLDTKEFETLNPTTENIALVIWNILRPLIEPNLKIKVILYETERNSAECGE